MTKRLTISRFLSLCRIALAVSLLALSASFWAGALQAADAPATVEEVSARLQKSVPDLPIDEIAATPVPGIFEVISEGQIYYIGENGRYLFEGNLIDLDSRENLTLARQSAISMTELAKMDESDMLIFEPGKQSAAMSKTADAGGDDAEKGDQVASKARTITVFTDTSCPYCSRLHEEISALTDANIRVRYLLYPRAGMDSDAARQLESVWCADNPQEAMTIAKQGGDVPAKTCNNPIESHVALAQKVGLRGTPMIFLDDGEVIPGYQPAAALIQMIESSSPL